MTGFVDATSLPSDGPHLRADVCIIGSGAGGAVAAAILATAGHEVLVVEVGRHRTRADFAMREDVAFANLYQEGAARTTRDSGIAILQGRSVGGSTVVNWTTCFRTPERVLDHWRVEFGVNGFDAGALAPHFSAVEERLHIAEIPLEHSNRNNRLLYDGCRAIGLSAEPIRRNVKQCMKTGYCGMGCPIDAKQSMLVTYLPDAIARGATVLHRCRVDRLEIAADRVVRLHGSVLGENGYAPIGALTIEAKRFIVSAGAINSPALLLRSGLGGADSPLGRRTFLHPVVPVMGRYQEVVEPYYGAPQSIASQSLVDRGEQIGLFFETAPGHPVLAAMVAPGLGSQHRRIIEELPRMSAHIALAIDGFSSGDAGGTVSLRPSGEPLLDYPFTPQLWEALREGAKTLVRVQFAAGAELARTSHDPLLEIESERDLAVIDRAPFESGRLMIFSAHQMGGCAMGSDPKRTVVRSEDLRHHRITNLHVIDGSIFPTSLGVNPQESIFGIAHLIAGRIAKASN